jgi:hypothetical protein
MEDMLAAIGAALILLVVPMLPTHREERALELLEEWARWSTASSPAGC